MREYIDNILLEIDSETDRFDIDSYDIIGNSLKMIDVIQDYICPFTDYCVNGSLWVLAQEKNIPRTIIKLGTMMAQACSAPATIFSTFYNGQFLTTDMSMCVESRFGKILNL